MVRQPGLFDLDERYAALSKNGDPLERLSAVVDFEIFRDDLDVALKRSDGSKRGRRQVRPDGTLMMEIATPAYGYKSHIGADRRHRFIRTWSVTDAARYDGRELPGVLD